MKNNNDVEIKPSETHFFVKMYALEQPKKDVKSSTKLSRTEKKLLGLLSKNKNITSKDLAEKIGITKRGIEKNIAKLKEKGLLIRIGSDKTGYWEVEDQTESD